MVAIIALATILSFILFVAVRDSDTRIADGFIGGCFRLSFTILRVCWLVGVIVLIFIALN